MGYRNPDSNMTLLSWLLPFSLSLFLSFPFPLFSITLYALRPKDRPTLHGFLEEYMKSAWLFPQAISCKSCRLFL
jgi:hypothetical protein